MEWIVGKTRDYIVKNTFIENPSEEEEKRRQEAKAQNAKLWTYPSAEPYKIDTDKLNFQPAGLRHGSLELQGGQPQESLQVTQTLPEDSAPQKPQAKPDHEAALSSGPADGAAADSNSLPSLKEVEDRDVLGRRGSLKEEEEDRPEDGDQHTQSKAVRAATTPGTTTAATIATAAAAETAANYQLRQPLLPPKQQSCWASFGAYLSACCKPSGGCCGFSLTFHMPIKLKRQRWQHRGFTCVRMDVPESYSRERLKRLLDEREIDYDFIYLPFDWGDKQRRNKPWRTNQQGRQPGVAPNKGYAFVNCVTHEEAQRMMDTLKGFHEWGVPCDKKCNVVVAYVTDRSKGDAQTIRKGRDEHVEFYRKNPVMHADVKDEYKPAIYDGPVGAKVLADFPRNESEIKKPRNLKKSNNKAKQAARG